MTDFVSYVGTEMWSGIWLADIFILHVIFLTKACESSNLAKPPPGGTGVPISLKHVKAQTTSPPGTGVLLQVYGEGYSQHKSGSAAAYELGLPSFVCFLIVKLVGPYPLLRCSHVIFSRIGFFFVAFVCVCVCVCVCCVLWYASVLMLPSNPEIYTVIASLATAIC
jgi:hypothetical protein